MPPRRKPARLWLRPERRRNGKVVAGATWLILDGGKHFPTGCAQGEVERAQDRLARHIALKYQPHRKRRDIEEIDVADVLSIYTHHIAKLDAPLAERPEATDPVGNKRFLGRMDRLAEFFGGMKLGDVIGETCMRYVTSRGRTGGARRDLEDLRAAIGYHQKLGLHRGTVSIMLPEKGDRRMRWLRRSEAARLLWVCWRCREHQTRHRGADKGKELPTGKRPLRHLARFILIGLYTGTRAGAIASASFHEGEGRSYVDLDAGVFYRLAQGRRRTNKRQPPVRLPDHLIAHLRPWARTPRRDGTLPEYVVEWQGKPVATVKTAFASAVRLAKLEDDASPHALRHTAATWLMQARADIWEAAGFLGMTPKILMDVYGHHHPDFQKGAANAVKNRPGRPASLRKTRGIDPGSPEEEMLK